MSKPSVDELVEIHAMDSSTAKSKLLKAIGLFLTGLAIVGVFIPGWPTVSWAVPAAFCFSLSSKSLFRWTLTNRFFGSAMYKYYSSGKTIPMHSKIAICIFIAASAGISAYGVFSVSYPADPGFGPATILIVGFIGIWYVMKVVGTRNIEIDT